MRQIDDPVRLRRRAANLERELAAAPARESTLAFLRGILEEVRFALDSPLEGTGFEPLVPLRLKALVGVESENQAAGQFGHKPREPHPHLRATGIIAITLFKARCPWPGAISPSSRHGDDAMA